MKQQIIVVHGGDTFRKYEEYISFLKSWQIDFERYRGGKIDWKKKLAEKLGDDFEVILPDMPNKINAKYAEWKIWFEKFIPYFTDNLIFIGHSLGGLFLAKYLSENKLPVIIKALFLIAAPHDDEELEESLADFVLPENLKLLQELGGKVFLYHSKDDPVVRFADFEKYKNALPEAKTRIFTNQGHCNQEEFPELIEDIKTLL